MAFVVDGPGREDGDAEWRQEAAGGPAGPPAPGSGGPPAGRREIDDGESMAVSVTRHAENTKQGKGPGVDSATGPQQWRFLASGIDTLDLGFYVEWGDRWDRLGQLLEKGKESAQGSKGILWEACTLEQCLILPGGKPPMYAYHLQLTHAHVYIQRRPAPTANPNVYVSPTAESLWKTGVREAIANVKLIIEHLGGKVICIKPSRCDLCADFLIPGGLSLAFLRGYRVTHAQKFEHHLVGDVLETFRVGCGGSSVQARIYDKSKEILVSCKPWFLDVWDIDENGDVWRVEFQLRRDILKQFGIDSVDSLLSWTGDLWEILTRSYFSLRLHDDASSERRTLHPWWQAVHAVADKFTRTGGLCRQIRSGTAPVDWYVAHIGGCLIAFAVRQGLANQDDAIKAMADAVHGYWSTRSFTDRYQIEAVRFGMPITKEGGSDAA